MGRSGNSAKRYDRRVLAVAVGVVLVTLGRAAPAVAHGPASDSAAALAGSRVVVHPAARDLVGQPLAQALSRQIGRAPLYVVVLPPGVAAERELAEVEAYHQQAGVYLVASGDDLAAGVVGQGGPGYLAVARTAVGAHRRAGGLASDLQAAVSALLQQLRVGGRPAPTPDASMVSGSSRAGEVPASPATSWRLPHPVAAVLALVLAAAGLLIRATMAGRRAAR